MPYLHPPQVTDPYIVFTNLLQIMAPSLEMWANVYTLRITVGMYFPNVLETNDAHFCEKCNKQLGTMKWRNCFRSKISQLSIKLFATPAINM